MTACVKCNGSGWYSYDHNHSKPCEVCCPHSQGVWLLTRHYYDSWGWCCSQGCGATWPGIVDYQRARAARSVILRAVA